MERKGECVEGVSPENRVVGVEVRTRQIVWGDSVSPMGSRVPVYYGGYTNIF